MALRTFKGSAPRWPWSRRLRRTVLTSLIAVGLAVAVGACSSGSSTSSASAGSASGKVGGSLTVWVDSVRLPAAQAYAKAHPNVHVHIVTFDGDANGATTLQAKIQLWNRTGNGWPDIIFSEQDLGLQRGRAVAVAVEGDDFQVHVWMCFGVSLRRRQPDRVDPDGQ